MVVDAFVGRHSVGFGVRATALAPSCPDPLPLRSLAPGTINVRMAAVRRLAYEAADSGLLSPELAADIHRVKGVRKLGSRLGNWLTAREASVLWQLPDGQTLTGKRNRAILAILLGWGCAVASLRN